MFEIDLMNRQSLLPIDDGQTRSIVIQTLQAEGISRAEVSISIVDDATIHEVNREYLDHDYPTDVISFLYESHDVHGDPTQRGLDGEVVVSAETAVRQAENYNWRPEQELCLYLVHGLLHLCGYDDQSPEDQSRMRDRERAVLQFWNLTPHYDS